MADFDIEKYNCNDNLRLEGILALCKEKEEKLNLAGEYGLKLQEELQESQRHMDEMRIYHEAQVENMIQEIYELKIKLETVEKSIEDQKIIMKQTVDDCQMSNERVIGETNEKVNLSKKEKASAFAQLNQLQLKERQSNERVFQLEEKIASLTAEKLKQREEINVSYSEEMFVLHEKIIDLEDGVDISKVEIINLRNKNETLCLALQTSQTEVINKQNELEVAEEKSTAFFNHLEKSREETTEVKVELDALKFQLKQSGHMTQGNSLFGEVEDKRMMMEKKLKTMEVKYESLQKAYLFLKSQHYNLKSQVTALLSLNSGKADLEYLSNIERALSQVKSENAELVSKLKGKVNESDEVGELKEVAKNLPNFESNKDMVEFLKIQLEESKSLITKLREELDQTHMVKMAETDKLFTAEQKLYETGTASEKYKNDNMKLRLKLEETENKYKAENQKRILVEKKFNYDSSNDVEPIGISNQNKIKSTPPFARRENKCKPTKLSKGEAKKTTLPSSDVSWNDVLKTLRKFRDNEKETEPVDSSGSDVATSSNERKVRFKEDADVLPPVEKENHNEMESELKTPCLKKPTASKTYNSFKESSSARSKQKNLNSNVTKERDEQSCDVQ